MEIEVQDPQEEIETTEPVEETTEETNDIAEEQASEPDEIVVSIEGEEPEEEEPKQAPTWVKELRKSHRELVRKNRELEDKLRATIAPVETVQLPKKPTLEDFNWDPDKYEASLADWFEKKRKFEAEEEKKKENERKANESWQNRLAGYETAKKELKVPDYEDAEAAVLSSMNSVQQGIIVKGASNPALVIYAIGRNPAKLKELSEVVDPIDFAFKIAQLEGKIKSMPRKAPPPEKTISSDAAKSGVVDSTLERLRAEAEKTNDYTKVNAYKTAKKKS